MVAHLEERRLEALGFWALLGERYRENPKIYKMLFEEKKQLGIPMRRGDTLSKSVWADYPEIPFLREGNREIAWKMLEGMSGSELDDLIRQLERLEDNHVYRALRGLITDFRYQINLRKNPRPRFGLDPRFKSCSSSGKKAPRRLSCFGD